MDLARKTLEKEVICVEPRQLAGESGMNCISMICVLLDRRSVQYALEKYSQRLFAYDDEGRLIANSKSQLNWQDDKK